MHREVTLVPVMRSERQEFLVMAEQYLRELNPEFSPNEDWKNDYFETIVANGDNRLRWISLAGEKIGFILYGLERHRFLPRRSGVVYELYVCPEHRRKGAARAMAETAIAELKATGPSKIQLEVATGNERAAAFWKSLGFESVAERYVLRSRER